MTPPIAKPCACEECKECRGCNRILRKQGSNEVDHPNTISVRRNGLCDRCANAERLGYRPGTDIRETMASLASYVANRRRRGVPAEGLRIAS